MNERNKNIEKDVVEVIPEDQVQQDVVDGLEEQPEEETEQETN